MQQPLQSRQWSTETLQRGMAFADGQLCKTEFDSTSDIAAQLEVIT